MKILVSCKNKKIKIDVKKTGFIRKGLGLTFRTRSTDNLLFEFDKLVTWEGTLTSLFVFFPFLAIWIDSQNRVVDFRIVKPFEISIKQKKKFNKIVELPVNKLNFPIIKQFIGANECKILYRRLI